MQRKVVKKMLQDWEQQFPGRTETIFSALRNVVPSHLADTQAFNFASLTPSPLAGRVEDAFPKTLNVSLDRASANAGIALAGVGQESPSTGRGEGEDSSLSAEEWFENEIEPA
jgi:hypothetical protein